MHYLSSGFMLHSFSDRVCGISRKKLKILY